MSTRDDQNAAVIFDQVPFMYGFPFVRTLVDVLESTNLLLLFLISSLQTRSRGLCCLFFRWVLRVLLCKYSSYCPYNIDATFYVYFSCYCKCPECVGCHQEFEACCLEVKAIACKPVSGNPKLNCICFVSVSSNIIVYFHLISLIMHTQNNRCLTARSRELYSL